MGNLNVAVVGGGISGCATALALLQRSHRVTVYEATPTLGGILRDLVTTEGRFFQGCQYFNLGSPLAALLDAVPGIELQTFSHRYGSWNDLFGEVVVDHDFAQIVVPGRMGAVPQAHAATAAQRLGSYEPRVAEALLRWAGSFAALETLEADNCGPMQIGRVFYRDDVDAVRCAKAENAVADRLLGLPRSRTLPPLTPQQAALPKGGFDCFFSRLDEALRDQGARIVCRSPIKPVATPDGPRFLVRGESIDADRVVWCANPVPLLLNLMGERIDAPVLNCFNLLAEISGRVPDEPVYYQVFSAGHPLWRVFCYTLDGAARLTVEGLDVGWPVERLAAAAQGVLNDINWDVRVGPARTVPQQRYTLLTCDDRHRFDRFAELAPALRVVPGGWQQYARDARMADILAALDGVEVT
jgi:glycine/D-amino acid oxidase-like deaminating enzyme